MNQPFYAVTLPSGTRIVSLDFRHIFFICCGFAWAVGSSANQAMEISEMGHCSAIIPLDKENGIECNGPASLLTEEGLRCAECFAEFGGTLATNEPMKGCAA